MKENFDYTCMGSPDCDYFGENEMGKMNDLDSTIGIKLITAFEAW